MASGRNPRGVGDTVARWMQQQSRMREIATGGGLGRIMDGQKRMKELTAAPAYGQVLENQKRAQDLATGGPLARMAEGHQRWQQLAGATTALSQIADAQKRWANLAAGGAVAGILENQQRRQEIPGLAGLQRFRDVTASFAVPGSIASPTLDLDAWASALADAGVVDTDAADDVLGEVEAADAEVSDGTSNLWWVERLSFERQFGLFVALMEALNRIADLGNATISDSLPDSYFKAVDLLVALAFVLILLMEAQADDGEE